MNAHLVILILVLILEAEQWEEEERELLILLEPPLPQLNEGFLIVLVCGPDRISDQMLRCREKSDRSWRDQSLGH